MEKSFSYNITNKATKNIEISNFKKVLSATRILNTLDTHNFLNKI